MAEAIKVGASARKGWADFLASSPPDSTEEVEGLFKAHPGVVDRRISLTPDVRVYCVSEECQGYRFFECNTSSFHVDGSTWSFAFVHYSCRNCRKNRKTFSVAVRPTSGGFHARILDTPVEQHRLTAWAAQAGVVGIIHADDVDQPALRVPAM